MQRQLEISRLQFGNTKKIYQSFESSKPLGITAGPTSSTNILRYGGDNPANYLLQMQIVTFFDPSLLSILSEIAKIQSHKTLLVQKGDFAVKQSFMQVNNEITTLSNGIKVYCIDPFHQLGHNFLNFHEEFMCSFAFKSALSHYALSF